MRSVQRVAVSILENALVGQYEIKLHVWKRRYTLVFCACVVCSSVFACVQSHKPCVEAETGKQQ